MRRSLFDHAPAGVGWPPVLDSGIGRGPVPDRVVRTLAAIRKSLRRCVPTSPIGSRNLPSRPGSRIFPPRSLSRRKRRLLDTLGCAAAALDEPAPAIARRVAAGFAASRGHARRRRRFLPRLGRVRQRRAHPLSRLQRHLSLARASPPQRQLGRGHGRGPGRRGERTGLDRRGRRGLRGPVPALRRREHPREGLGPHHLRVDLGHAGRGAGFWASITSRPSTPSASPARPARHCG